MRDDFVSIILCTFNGLKFLDAQIQSLLTQSHGNFEIIAIDDASTDGTLDFLRTCAALDARIVVRARDEQAGLNAGIEEGLTLARGNFVALADQDDIWEANKLEILLEEVRDDSAVYCASALIDDQDRPLGRTLLSALGPIEPRSGNDPWELFWQNSVSGHASLFRASLIPHLLPLDPALMHDHQIGIVAAARGGLRYCDRPLVRHRIHRDNYVNRLSERQPKPARTSLQKRQHKIRRREHWRSMLLERADFYASRIRDPRFSAADVDSLRNAHERLGQKTFDFALWWTLLRHRRLLLARDPRPFRRAFQGAKGRGWYDRGDLASLSQAGSTGIARSGL